MSVDRKGHHTKSGAALKEVLRDSEEALHAVKMMRRYDEEKS